MVLKRHEAVTIVLIFQMTPSMYFAALLSAIIAVTFVQGSGFISNS